MTVVGSAIFIRGREYQLAIQRFVKTAFCVSANTKISEAESSHSRRATDGPPFPTRPREERTMTATKNMTAWDTADRYDANGILTTKAAFTRMCDIAGTGRHETEMHVLCAILRERGVNLDWDKLRNFV
jgi:hypothetical protein